MSVEVYSCDKIGHFIGNLYIPGAKESLCLSLLKQGCVYINDKAIGFCSNADAMEDAEDEAKEARRGYWKNYAQQQKVRVGCVMSCSRRRWRSRARCRCASRPSRRATSSSRSRRRTPARCGRWRLR